MGVNARHRATARAVTNNFLCMRILSLPKLHLAPPPRWRRVNPAKTQPISMTPLLVRKYYTLEVQRSAVL